MYATAIAIADACDTSQMTTQIITMWLRSLANLVVAVNSTDVSA
jgi:hypothetical protein